ncbi:MAG: hypothetical protein HY952_06905 [Elusimicrobia bacterium]|nr:hypothetical protein [Elusimicrobiota bacterium]
MTRSEPETVFFYSLAGYMTVSLLATSLILLSSLAAMKLVFSGVRLNLGPEEVYRLKPLFCASAGFALASVATAVLQFFLASLLLLSGLERRVLGAAVLAVSVFSGLFFWRGAAHSALGAYPFSGLPVTLSALCAGFCALFQKPGENPWPFTAAALFR